LYILGIDPKNPKKAEEAHQAFKGLIRQCAAEIPIVQAVANFLDNLPSIDTLFRDLGIAEKDFDYLGRIVFEVDGDQLIDLPEIQRFWAKINASQDENKAECLVCRESKTPVEKLSTTIGGIPGGQAAGVSLISAYEPAFWSYGLSTSLNSPMCEECATKCTNALNSLIETKNTRLYILTKLKKKGGENTEEKFANLYTGSSIYLFWSKYAEDAADFNRIISEAQPEDIAALLTSHWEGKQQEIENVSAFYAATISARSGRIILRDWMETTISSARDNLQRYFHLQGVITSSGERWFPLWHLAMATVREGDPQPIVGTSLIRCAIRGEALPLALLPIVLNRVYSGTKIGDKRVYCTTPQSALIKMILLSQSDISWIGTSINTKEKYQLMKELDKACDDTAYLLGRLFATLEYLQRVALGDTNATIADRYLRTATTSPASAFPSLMQKADAHLSELRKNKKGLYRYISDEITEIMQQLKTHEFPYTLTMQEQGQFIIGRWQAKNGKKATLIEATAVAEEAELDND
jgi:CRISPR-associated protein Csd1